ncbi:MAG: hypothetical protein ABI401_08405 [Candidatus Dormibacter sp.]
MLELAFHAGWSDTATLALLVLLHSALLAIPALLGAVIAARLAVRSQTLLVIAAFLATAIDGYLAFWVYLAGSAAGHVLSYGFPVAAVVTTLVLWRRLTPEAVRLIRGLWVPGALVVFAALFVVSLGFMYGGLGHPLEVSGNRFTYVLPGDNLIPLLFAQALNAPTRPLPSHILGDWLFSDRPPLQAGYVVAQYPLFWFSEPLQYEVLSVILQCFSVVGLWIYLIESRASHLARVLGVAVTVASGFFLINGFYVWPKLLPAGFLLLLAAILLTHRYRGIRGNAIAGVGCGALAGFAMLGHEGSAFALAAIALTMLALRRVPSLRFLVPAGLVIVLCLAPWMWFQHAYDPPGNRLLKWHLAGQVAVTSDGSLSTILHRYEHAGLVGTGQNKRLNFTNLAGDPRSDLDAIHALVAAVNPGPALLERLRRSADALRVELFLKFMPMVGLMALGLPAALIGIWRTRSRGHPLPGDLVAGAVSWICIGSGLVVWCLVLFGPAATAPHSGTYLFELLVFGGSTCAFCAISPRLGLLVAALQIAFMLVVYVVLTPSPDSLVDVRRLGSGFNGPTGLTAGLALAAILILVGRPSAEIQNGSSTVPAINKSNHTAHT